MNYLIAKLTALEQTHRQHIVGVVILFIHALQLQYTASIRNSLTRIVLTCSYHAHASGIVLA